MWYDVDVFVEAGFTISAEAETPEEAAEVAEAEAVRRIKHFNYVAYVETKVKESDDQSTGKPR